jgi:carboxyl-terminal processing protease
MIRLLFLLLAAFLPWIAESKPPQLSRAIVSNKLNEIMKAHASHQQLTPELISRVLQNYLEELDPNKMYFIEPDIQQWVEPTDALLQQVLNDYKHSDFSTFEQIHAVMSKAILRHHLLEKQIPLQDLPSHVSPKEFKDMKWAKNEAELTTRLTRIKALQVETSKKLTEDIKDTALQRIQKHKLKFEEEVQNPDPIYRENFILTHVLKAMASALDAHTAYFTPEEAKQFMINVQQRLFGIGAQLRDDLNGFTLVKIIEGGPAALGKELKAKDRIIAVNGEPVVGMDIVDAVELIRGGENTPVTLTIVREVKEGDATKEETKEIVVHRGEVVLKESRYEASYEPFGEGIIAYLRLHSFYQDPEYSSAEDLAKEIKKLESEHELTGVILDLRYNTGGLLSQAVDVAGLFISKGIVVSIKDNTGAIQHLRHLDSHVAWKGPLLILINRASASASEIVAQTLQDYGRALVIGDDHTFGKGSFQNFTLNTTNDGAVNPEGEYKVTRGRYYTVSGKTPQLTGVLSDIVVPGPLSQMDIGEKYAKYPLENDEIKENYDDDLSDISFAQRNKVRMLYKFDLQSKLSTYQPFLKTLKANSAYRIEHNKNYQTFLKELQKEDPVVEEEGEESFGQNDLQLTETYNIMKDLILILQHHCTKNPH